MQYIYVAYFWLKNFPLLIQLFRGCHVKNGGPNKLKFYISALVGILFKCLLKRLVFSLCSLEVT